MSRKTCLLFLIILFIATGCDREAPRAGGGPRIGITYGTIQEKLLSFGIDINSQYRSVMENYGAVIVKISVNDSPGEVDGKLSLCDGILIPGGYDVNPLRYGEKPDARLESTDNTLDALEYRVLNFARDRGLPVLGICRGAQMINVFHGGSLYQDIPSMFRAQVPVLHRKQLNLYFYRHATECLHDIVLENEGRLKEILKNGKITANSYHHQAVKNPAPGFRISARSMDGSAEAIEYTGDRFILGVQFHPEKMVEDEPAMNEIFRTFIESVTALAITGNKTGGKP